MKNIYFDYAATTPMDKRVFDAMKPYFKLKDGLFGNPNSIHKFGQMSLSAMDDSRSLFANTISAKADEITFTASATEANNIIIRGVVKAYRKKFKDTNKKLPKIIVSSIEHPSILETVKDLEGANEIDVFYIPVDKDGLVSIKEIEKEITPETILISVMFVNNETGVIQPIEKIINIVNRFRVKNNTIYPIIHTDAVQAFVLNDVDVSKNKVDAMTISAHKMYGPKGVGALYISDIVRNESLVDKIITGGGQENNMRSGTQNVASIVGFAKASEICVNEKNIENRRLKKISEYLYDSIKKINGISLSGNINIRSPHILNVVFPKEDMATALDVGGFAVSSGSACSQRLVKPSYVLKNMGRTDDEIRRSLRISIGRFTTKKDIDLLIKKIIILCDSSHTRASISKWCDN